MADDSHGLVDALQHLNDGAATVLDAVQSRAHEGTRRARRRARHERDRARNSAHDAQRRASALRERGEDSVRVTARRGRRMARRRFEQTLDRPPSQLRTIARTSRKVAKLAPRGRRLPVLLGTAAIVTAAMALQRRRARR